MDFFIFDNLPKKEMKGRIIQQSLKWLALKPELIGDVKTDKELIERVIQFAKVLSEYDTDYDFLSL
jgi:hypothetical protein